MQKFIVQKIYSAPSKSTITGQDAKHISKVLRLTTGDCIIVTNGQSQDFTAKIRSVSPAIIELDILNEIETFSESPIDITLCSGMLKDKKMDIVIKHVTQLGIDKWVPFFCNRSIPSPDTNRLKKRIQRWETIAKESLKQCGRSKIPHILPPIPFEELLNYSANYDLKIAFWENETQPLSSLIKTPSHQKILVLIGPEGGFTENEITMTQKNGFLSYSIGPRILRAETASIACCALIQHILGDL